MMNEIFHHLHHLINRMMRNKNPNIPNIQEERNPIFFVYIICMVISLILCILWLNTNLLNRKLIIAVVGNAIGGILTISGGISAMRHAEKHINLNEVSDEELLLHPIFIHNFTICIISIFSMLLYVIPMWILFDIYKWNQNRNKLLSTTQIKKVSIKAENYCMCSHSKKNCCFQYNPRIKERNADIKNINPTSDSSFRSVINVKAEENVQNEPIILYCCCIDFYRYLKTSKNKENYTHEFQIIQIM